MESVKSHINSKWFTSKHKGAVLNTLGGNSTMGEMGFTEDFTLADIGDFYNEFQCDKNVEES